MKSTEVAALFCKDYQSWGKEYRPLGNSRYTQYGKILSKKQAAWLSSVAKYEVQSHRWHGVCNIEGDTLAVSVLFHHQDTAMIHVYSMAEYNQAEQKSILYSESVQARLKELLEMIN